MDVPSRQVLGDLGPAVPELLVQLVDEAVLLLRPRRLLNVGVQVVVPPVKQRREILTMVQPSTGST